MSLEPTRDDLAQAYRLGAPDSVGHERAEAVLAVDGGVVVLCTSEPDRTRLVHLDDGGAVAREDAVPELAGRALAALPGGGLAVAGDVVLADLAFRAAVRLLDPAGRVAAAGSFGLPGPTGFAAVAVVDDGIVAGGTASWAGWLVRLDADLRISWERTLADVDGVQALVPFGGGVAVAATEERSTTGFGTTRLLLLGPDGDVERQLTLPADGRAEPTALAALEDGLVVAGHHAVTEQDGARIWVVRVDAGGEPVWERRLGGPDEERRGRAVAALPDGGVAVAGDALRDGRRSLRVARLEPDGSTAWERAYEGSGADVACGLALTGDGGLVVAGSASPRDGATSPRVLRLDGRGEVLWDTTLRRA